MYNKTISIKLPALLADVASAIGRALDPDVGGAASFSLSDDEQTISTSTPCTAEFYEQAQAMLADPALLHQAVVDDYAARWADLTPPSLADCEFFCASVIYDAVPDPLPDAV